MDGTVAIYRENPQGEGIVRLAEMKPIIVACHMMLPIRLSINAHDIEMK